MGETIRIRKAPTKQPIKAPNRGISAVKAIKTLINETVQITEFLIQAMNKGSDDVGRVHVQVKCGSMLVHGFSANTDVVKAAVEAFVDGLNLLNVTEKTE